MRTRRLTGPASRAASTPPKNKTPRRYIHGRGVSLATAQEFAARLAQAYARDLQKARHQRGYRCARPFSATPPQATAGTALHVTPAFRDGANPVALLHPSPEEALQEWIVSPRVNRSDVGDDDPTIGRHRTRDATATPAALAKAMILWRNQHNAPKKRLFMRGSRAIH